MPILTVRIGATKSRETTQRVSALLIELTARILRKPPQFTVIVIDYVDPADWIVAGRSLAERGLASFTFDIKVTDETNTKDEKAQYIREAFEGFRKILGDMHEESYIYVDDVRAAAYGYGGRTQESRYQHPPASPGAADDRAVFDHHRS
jgi:4-oxalocrotonate tautomerase